MFDFRIAFTVLVLITGTANAQSSQPAPVTPSMPSKQSTLPPPDVKELMTKALPDYAGKEMVMITVDYPPGGGDPVHTHDAHAFVYVLEGSIVMGVKGKEPVTLTPGQTFYEGPDDIHTVGRNASATQPARFVVLLLKKSGEPIFTPVN